MTSIRNKKQHLPLQAFCLLALVIAAAACLHLPVRAEAGSRKIVFIRSNLKPDPGSAMVEQFKATLRKRGYVEGNNIEYVDILIQKTGRESVQEARAAAELHQDSTDLFVTAGAVTTHVRSRLATRDIPQLFAPVLKEEALRMLPSVTDPPGTNLSGVYLAYPPQKILNLARLILPGIKNYAFVFDSRISTDLLMKEAFDRLKEEDRRGMAVHQLDVAEGTEGVLQQMKTLRIEAFGGIIGAYKNREALSASGVPMITGLLMDIDVNGVADRIREGNILAGLFDPMDYCGEQAGEMAADLLDGKNTLAATMPRPGRQVSFVNMATAARLNVAIPFTVLEAVDIVVK